MNITLDQLKEIAKAGYNRHPSILLDIENNSIAINNNTIHTDSILLCVIKQDDFIHIQATDTKFNHLAAIRKMEELGIIEK